MSKPPAKPRRQMTAEELFLSKRVKRPSGFFGSLLRSIERGKGTITESQADWLWELAWKNREELRRAGAGSVWIEAARRHEAFDFRRRVRNARNKARSGKDPFENVELTVGTDAEVCLAMEKLGLATKQARTDVSGLAAAVQEFGASLSECARGFAAVGNSDRGIQQKLPNLESPG